MGLLLLVLAGSSSSSSSSVVDRSTCPPVVVVVVVGDGLEDVLSAALLLDAQLLQVLLGEGQQHLRVHLLLLQDVLVLEQRQLRQDLRHLQPNQHYFHEKIHKQKHRSHTTHFLFDCFEAPLHGLEPLEVCSEFVFCKLFCL